MAIFVFGLGLILAIVGGAAIVSSLDLLPTELGMLYAVCGSVAVSAACIVLAIGALIRRVDAIRFAPAPETVYETIAPREAPPVEPEVEHEDVIASEAPALAEAPTAALEEEDLVNENRAGHLPTLAEVEQAIAHPEEPPTLVGRYSAGGASYMIFSDGTIEAETEQGAFRFASMGDFKAYIAGRKS